MLRPRALNLTAALAVVAVLELLLHRLVGRLFLPQRPGGLAGLAADAGRFVYHLGGVLGLVVLIAALARALRSEDLFPRSMRFAVVLIASVLTLLAAVGVLAFPLPDRWQVHLKTSQAFLAWFIVIAAWRGPGLVRGKLAVTLFALPAVLQAVALFADRAGWLQPFPGELARAGEIAALVAAALCPYLVAPDPLPPLRRLAGVGAGMLALAAVIVALSVNFDLMQAMALYGFRVDLPPLSSSAAVTYVALVIAAAVGLAMAVVWTLPGPGGARLVGYGLLLVGAAGQQALVPGQVLFAVCGLLAMALGNSRVAPAPPGA